MSLKNVELQVALPRTLEVSRIQDQQQHRSVHEQLSLMDERTLHDQQMRQRPMDIEQTDKNKLREREQKHGREKREAQAATPAGEHAEEGKKSVPVEMKDPFRGRFIDLSL
ncbi:hypothetical protein ACFSO0_15470 [Brevibacillus sp. GCM10020057]|uniref:hypothetical protein n=1 Tax=Brevibacillus sp. GCM10020057 TaxID=3317327 RepID=UPI003643A3D5